MIRMGLEGMMKNYKEFYKHLVDQIIEKSFPSLRNKLIFVNEIKIFNFRHSANTTYLIFLSFITIHPKVKKYPKKAIIALLAHELAHLDIIARKNLFRKISFAFNWLFTRKGKFNFERDADTLTVNKGYGKGLAKLVKLAKGSPSKERLKNKSKKGYLSEKEIRKFITK